jgi:phage tail-like protein
MTNPLVASSAFNFEITIDGLNLGAITEVSEFKMELETKPLATKVGRQLVISHQVTGVKPSAEITITRPLQNLDLFNWYSACVAGGPAAAYKHGSLKYHDAGYTKVIAEWTFANSYPKAYGQTGAKVESGGSTMEKITVVFMDLTVVGG